MKTFKHLFSKILGVVITAQIWIKKIAAIILILATITSIAQINAGRYTMTRAKAPNIVNPIKVRAGVSSFGFALKVGGVAFGEVAQSLDGSFIEYIKYYPNRDDGMRLVALITTTTDTFSVILPVYDWEFIPAARFALGNQDALITYFGELSDNEEEKKHRDMGCKIVNYHFAIDNTLIGFRLMQSDLLAFHEIAPLNPIINGYPIKANSETLSSEKDNALANKKIQDNYRQMGVRSYIICDVDQKIGFKLVNDLTNHQLNISGYPYWSCWNFDDYDEDEFYMEIMTAFVETLSHSEQELLLKSLDNGNPLPSTIQRKLEIFSEKANNDKLEQIFMKLPKESDQLSDLMKQFEGGNPPVYKSLCTFMRYAALFRFVKERNPISYYTFVNSLRNVRPKPEVETPTIICEN